VSDVAPDDADNPVRVSAPDSDGDPADPTHRIGASAYTGRAAAKVQPNRGRLFDDIIEYTVAPAGDAGDDPASGRGARARGALIVGGVIAALITVATISIIHMTARAGCPPAGCVAGSGRTALPGHTTGQPTVQPAGGATATPSAVRTDTTRATSPPLAAVMPADIRLPACRTTDDDPFLANVIAYFACQQPATAQLPYLQVWGYQFADQTTYERGVEAFNEFVKFDPAKAEGKCPPAATYGSVEWHTSAAPEVAAGTLECYSDSSENHYYVWTDDAERTILVAESAPTQTFADLDAWWRQNNRNA
jgi:hypothetical protein